MLEVSLHNQPSEIAVAHEALDRIVAQHGLSARAASRLHLAIEEHVTNIISHGYQSGRTGTITARFSLEGPVLQVEIKDDAEAFNPLAAPEVDTTLPLEEKPVGGLGIHLIRQSVDALEYRREGNRNILVMTVRVGDS